eukprot:5287700-Amphidinium_carterae.3
MPPLPPCRNSAHWTAVETAAQKTADELSASAPFPVCSPRLEYVTCLRALRVLRRKDTLRSILKQLNSTAQNAWDAVLQLALQEAQRHEDASQVTESHSKSAAVLRRLLLQWRKSKLARNRPIIRVGNVEDPSLEQQHWSKVFSRQFAVDWNIKVEMLAPYVPALHWPEAFRELPSTAPGPSGLGYPMIKRSANLLAPVLAETFEDTCTGVLGPCNWTDSRLVFITKKDGTVLAPSEMRPLSCSNIDAKIVNRAVAWQLRLLFPAIHHCQRGFRLGQPVSIAVFDLERIA